MYLHRVGRTGRAGQSGTAVSIVADWEAGFIGQYRKGLENQHRRQTDVGRQDYGCSQEKT